MTTTKQRKASVVVEGFLVALTCPTSHLLNVPVNMTRATRTEYMRWKEGLEDILFRIDKKYAKAYARGKSHVKATYRTEKDGEETTRVRELQVNAYPSIFSNVLSRVRSKAYEELNRRALTISQVQNRKLYLLPHREAPAFFEFIQGLNAEIIELQRKVKRYERSADFTRVVKKLAQVNPWYDHRTNRPHSTLHGVEVDINPLRIDANIYDNFIKSWKDKDRERLEKEYGKGLSAIRKELERKQREIVEQGVIDLETRLTQIVQRIASYASMTLSSKSVESVRRDLDNLKRLTESANLGYFMRRRIDVGLNLLDALESKEEEEIEQAAEKVGRLAGIETSGMDPSTILKVTARTLTSDISDRAKALMSELF